MPKLTETSVTLIMHGARTHRTLDMLPYIEESLAMNQALLVGGFLEWCQTPVGAAARQRHGFNENTIRALFAEYAQTL